MTVVPGTITVTDQDGLYQRTVVTRGGSVVQDLASG
jgi:hypothetical protein